MTLKPNLRSWLIPVALHLGCDEGNRSASISSTNTTTLATPTVQFKAPEVPPLLSGEVPPTDQPNYFDSREFGTGALVAYIACLQAFDESAPDTSEEAIGAYCTCFADAARKNVRAGEPPKPSNQQSDTCFAYARHPTGPSPLALSPATERIAATFGACMDATGSLGLDAVQRDAAVRYKGFLCGCITDAAIKDVWKGNGDTFSLCDVAARHAVVTGSNLTPRQFGLLAHPKGQPAPAAGPTFRYEVAPPTGSFIAYPGNGLGPTPCADGAWSNSTGGGTCSDHGGVAGKRHRGRH